MAYTVDQIRQMAAGINPRIAVWCANGTGKQGKPGYMGDVTVALLPEGVERKARACDHKGQFEQVYFFTAWRGLISATRQVRQALEQMRDAK